MKRPCLEARQSVNSSFQKKHTHSEGSSRGQWIRVHLGQVRAGLWEELTLRLTRSDGNELPMWGGLGRGRCAGLPTSGRMLACASTPPLHGAPEDPDLALPSHAGSLPTLTLQKLG